MVKSKWNEGKVAWKKQGLDLTQWLYRSNVEQLHQELHAFLVVCVVTGCAPVAVLPSCRRRFYEAVQLAWLFLLYFWLCTAAYFEMNHDENYQNSLEQRVYNITAVINLIHVPCIFIMSLGSKRRLQGLFEAVGRFDLASGYVMGGQEVRKFLRWQLLLVLFFAGYSAVVAFFYNEQQAWDFIIDWSTYVAPNALSGISLVIYYTLMEGIYRRLHHMATSLRQEVQRGAFIRAKALQELRWQHRNLLHFTKRVNQTFGVSILVLYISSLINAVTSIFLAYSTYESSRGMHWSWWAYNSLWITMHTVKMFLILYYNQKVKAEQETCLTLLTSVSPSDEDFLETINHFTLQLQDNVRSHIACGLFELDYKLITSLLMMSATLFIFLLQYNMTFQALTISRNRTAV